MPDPTREEPTDRALWQERMEETAEGNMPCLYDENWHCGICPAHIDGEKPSMHCAKNAAAYLEREKEGGDNARVL